MMNRRHHEGAAGKLPRGLLKARFEKQGYSRQLVARVIAAYEAAAPGAPLVLRTEAQREILALYVELKQEMETNKVVAL